MGVRMLDVRVEGHTYLDLVHGQRRDHIFKFDSRRDCDAAASRKSMLVG